MSRTLAIPFVLTSWFTLKSAAAALAITAGAVTLGAVTAHEIRVVRTLATPIMPQSARAARASSAALQSEASVAPALPSSRFADLDEPVNAPLVAAAPRERIAAGAAAAGLSVRGARRPSGDSGSGASNGAPTADNAGVNLTAEAAMLELARRALDSSPNDALGIVDEHRARFPKATLALERELIRVEALSRLGRKHDALFVAQRLRQHAGFYAERIDRLIERIENSGE
jgi:hypothetical protein